MAGDQMRIAMQHLAHTAVELQGDANAGYIDYDDYDDRRGCRPVDSSDDEEEEVDLTVSGALFPSSPTHRHASSASPPSSHRICSPSRHIVISPPSLMTHTHTHTHTPITFSLSLSSLCATWSCDDTHVHSHTHTHTHTHTYASLPPHPVRLTPRSLMRETKHRMRIVSTTMLWLPTRPLHLQRYGLPSGRSVARVFLLLRAVRARS
jgi:hypothetical protein